MLLPDSLDVFVAVFVFVHSTFAVKKPFGFSWDFVPLSFILMFLLTVTDVYIENGL